jgi:hypothetical protein
VYWADSTFTVVTPILSESYTNSAQSIAGYWLPNYASLPNLTLAQLLGSIGLVQVAGFLPGAWGPTSGAGANVNIIGSGTAFQSTGSASVSAVRQLGVQLTAAVSGLCNVLVQSDII